MFSCFSSSQTAGNRRVLPIVIGLMMILTLVIVSTLIFGASAEYRENPKFKLVEENGNRELVTVHIVSI